MYYVYMLTNRTNRILYIGVTKNIVRRLYEHQQEVVEGFSKRYHLHKLVYFEEYSYMADAISREKQLKRWTRAQKNALIAQQNPLWDDLSQTVFGNAPLPQQAPVQTIILTETDLALSENAVDSLLAVLPPTWRARAERYKPLEARLRSAVGYSLLARILREQHGLDDLPAVDIDDRGRPFLVGSSLYFSISHCKAAVACVVSAHPIGLDVQDRLTGISPALAARIAAPQNPDGLSPRELATLWAQKEASAKLDGRGLKIGIELLPLPHHTLTVEDYDRFVLCVAEEE